MVLSIPHPKCWVSASANQIVFPWSIWMKRSVNKSVCLCVCVNACLGDNVDWFIYKRTYSQHFISFIAYEWVQQATVVLYTRLERLARDKCSSSLDQFISYEGNKVLWTQPQGTYSQHFIFFIAYKWVQQATVLLYSRLESLARDKRASLLDPFISYEGNKVLWIQPQGT
jgi:hypothetical protein